MEDRCRHEHFMQLYLPVQRKLYGYVRTLVPNPADADDVIQASAAVMWEKFDDFDPETRFEYWAYHIAYLQALCHLKQRKRSKLVFSDAVLALLADRSAALVGASNDVMDALSLCVEYLSEQDRELLRARFEPGATSRSVALTMGRSESTISRALGRVYGDLMECVQRNAAVSQKQGGRP